MKPFLFLAACLAIQNALAADFIRFAENLTDRNICAVEDGERFCDIVTFNSGAFSARVTIPGLAGPFEPNTSVSLVLGNFDFTAQLSEADVLTSNRAAFYFTYYDNNDHLRRYGAIVFSLSSNLLSVAAASRPLISSIVADEGAWDANGKGTTAFSVNIAGQQFQRTVYFTATATQRPPPEPGGAPLRNIVAIGKADYTRPTVTVVSPRNRARVADSVVTFQGTARDSSGVGQVLYRVGASDWLPATGTSNWTATVALAPGTNIVQVKSVDVEMQESRITSRTIVRTP